MATRSISIALEARVQGFVAGMRTAQQATTDFANRTASFARDNEEHLDRVGKSSMVMGGALLAGVGLAVKAFMDFDKAMSEVESTVKGSAAEMDQLREAAIAAGADTAFSAEEAAKGIDELAKAGVSTKDILSGGLKGALDLAAAGSLDVATAAEIAATALTQFKLSGDKVPHLADLLAAGAGKAQGSVEDMGMALKQAGLVAASTGLNIEETTGGLAAFASAGLIGSDAGTSFKSMLQRLTPQSKEAEAKMRELGISAYDAQGEFIGLAEFSENLKTAFAGQSDEARNAAMGVIFGSDAIRAANVLYENGAEGIKKWTNNVNEAGYAAVTASIKQDNLAGDLEKLGGSFDSLLIKSGGGVAESLRGLVQGAEDLVDAFGKIPAPILNAGLGIAGIAGGALLLGGALMTALPKVMEFRGSMSALATSSPRAAAGITRVGKAAGVAVVALVAMQAASAIFGERHTKSAEDYGQAILKVQKIAGSNAGTGLDSIFGNFDKEFGVAVSNIDNLGDAVNRLTHQDLNDSGSKLFEPLTAFLGFPKGEISQLEDRLKGLGDEMGNLAKSGAGETAAKSFQALTAEFEKNGKGAKEALAAVPGYETALKGLANQAGVTLTEQELLDFAMGKIPASMQGAAGATESFKGALGQSVPITEDMAKALEEIGISADGAVTNLGNLAKALFAAGLMSLSTSDAAIGYQDAIDKVSEAALKNGTSLDINTEKGRANQSALNDLASSGIAYVTTMAEETDANGKHVYSQEQIQGSLKQTYLDLIASAGQFGITGDKADTLARKALGIPKTTNIDSYLADYASQKLDGIKGKAEALDGKKVNVSVTTTYYDILKTKDERTANEYLDNSGMGSVAKKAAGGRVYGPGTTTSDSIPHMLSKDEYVIKASAAKAIGYDNLDRLNGGNTKPLKSAFQYSPASAPARQAAPASAPNSGPMQMTGTLVMDSGEVLGVFRGVAVAAAQGVVSAADSQSQFARRGR